MFFSGWKVSAVALFMITVWSSPEHSSEPGFSHRLIDLKRSPEASICRNCTSAPEKNWVRVWIYPQYARYNSQRNTRNIESVKRTMITLVLPGCDLSGGWSHRLHHGFHCYQTNVSVDAWPGPSSSAGRRLLYRLFTGAETCFALPVQWERSFLLDGRCEWRCTFAEQAVNDNSISVKDSLSAF